MGLIAGVGDFGLTELRDETLQYRNEAQVILDSFEETRTITTIAGVDLPDNSVVALIDNKAYLFDSTNDEHFSSQCGFVLSSVSYEESVIVYITGSVNLNESILEVNTKYFSGNNGDLIDVIPENFGIQSVGYALSSTKLVLDFSERFVKNKIPESSNNKSTDVNLGASDVFYPTQKAVKTYVDSFFANITFIWKLFTGFTIAELRAITDTQLALVSSFSCNEMGYFPKWYYDSSDTTSTDDGVTILVTGNGKRLKAKIENFIKVDNFGAKGDGTSNDTLAFSKAIDFCFNSSTIKTIFCSDATYLVDSILLKSDITIYFGKAKIKKRVNGGTINTNSLVRTVETLVSGSYYGTYKNIELNGGFFYGNGKTSPANLFSITFVENLKIKNITVSEYSPSNFAFAIGGKNITIENISIYGGYDLFEDGIHILFGQNIVINNCYIESGDDSIALGRDTNYTYADTDANMQISNVTISNINCKSQKANNVTLYSPSESTSISYSISNVTIVNLNGTGGIENNGNIYIGDKGIETLALNNGRIKNVKISKCNFNCGSSTHGDTNAIAVRVYGAEHISLDDIDFNLINNTGATNGLMLVNIYKSKYIYFNKIDCETINRRESFLIDTSENISISNSLLSQVSTATSTLMRIQNSKDIIVDNIRLLNVNNNINIIEVTVGATNNLFVYNSTFSHISGATNGYAINNTSSSTPNIFIIGCNLLNVAGISGNKLNQGAITSCTNYRVSNNIGGQFEASNILNLLQTATNFQVGNSQSTSSVATFLGGKAGAGVIKLQRTDGISAFFELHVLGNLFGISQNGGFFPFTTAVSGSNNIITVGQDRGTSSPRTGYITAESILSGGATNVTGADLFIQSGSGTGDSNQSGIGFQTPDITSSGSNQQSRTTKMKLFGNGNLTIGTTPTDNGEKLQIDGNISLKTAGNKLKIATGTNASVGTAVLVAGNVTVNTTAVTTDSLIYVDYHGSATISTSVLTYHSIISGTSFVITAITAGTATTNTADTNTVKWLIIN